MTIFAEILLKLLSHESSLQQFFTSKSNEYFLRKTHIQISEDFTILHLGVMIEICKEFSEKEVSNFILYSGKKKMKSLDFLREEIEKRFVRMKSQLEEIIWKKLRLKRPERRDEKEQEFTSTKPEITERIPRQLLASHFDARSSDAIPYSRLENISESIFSSRPTPALDGEREERAEEEEDNEDEELVQELRIPSSTTTTARSISRRETSPTTNTKVRPIFVTPNPVKRNQHNPDHRPGIIEGSGVGTPIPGDGDYEDEDTIEDEMIGSRQLQSSYATNHSNPHPDVPTSNFMQLSTSSTSTPLLVPIDSNVFIKGNLPLITSSAPFSTAKPELVLEISNGTITLHNQRLQAIVSRIPSETEIGIISIGGEFRKGKSFFLNFILKYLKFRQNNPPPTAQVDQNEFEELIHNRSHPWLSDVSVNDGFSFKSGLERHTTGIIFWSEPFVIKRQSGKDLAVLVIDSQGLYDENTNDDDNVRIFTIISLLSSHLLLNTPQIINFKQLSELEFFMAYATANSTVAPDSKPFQRLTFLIRDYDLEESYGFAAGREVLDRFFKPNNNQSADVKNVARNLTKAFNVIDSFALPFPGEKVTKKNFTGSLVDIDSEFLRQTEIFVVDAIEKLEPRSPLGITMTGASMVGKISRIVKMMNDKLSPSVWKGEEEREAVVDVLAKIDAKVESHESALHLFFSLTSAEYFLETDFNGIEDDVHDVHYSIMNIICRDFRKKHPVDILITSSGPERRQIKSVDYLRKRIENQFAKIEPQLHQIVVDKISEAELEEEAKLLSLKEKYILANTKKLKDENYQQHHISFSNIYLMRLLDRMAERDYNHADFPYIPRIFFNFPPNISFPEESPLEKLLAEYELPKNDS